MVSRMFYMGFKKSTLERGLKVLLRLNQSTLNQLSFLKLGSDIYNIFVSDLCHLMFIIALTKGVFDLIKGKTQIYLK